MMERVGLAAGVGTISLSVRDLVAVKFAEIMVTMVEGVGELTSAVCKFDAVTRGAESPKTKSRLLQVQVPCILYRCIVVVLCGCCGNWIFCGL